MKARGYSILGARARSRVLAIGAALVIAALYASFASREPAAALKAFFVAPFSSRYAFLALLESSSPLLLCALGAIVAFRAGAFNLGGEGQASVGTLAAASAATLAGSLALPPGLGLGASILAAGAAGAALAWASARLERSTGAPVMLTSFLLSQAAMIAVDWALGGPLRDPLSNLLGMAPVGKDYLLPALAPPTPLTLAFPIAACAALVMLIALRGTRIGVELRFLGKSPDFARAIGIPPALRGAAMVASGALAGMAGACMTLGQAGRAIKGMTGGVGWNGLAAALIAGSDGGGALPAALFLSWLDSGARQASMLADLSPDASAVLIAATLLLVTARPALRGRLRRSRGSGSARGGEAEGEGS